MIMPSPVMTQRVIPPITNELSHRGYWINNTLGGCFVPILDAGINLLEHMTTKYQRVFFFAFTLNLPYDFNLQERGNPLPQFINSFKANRKANRKEAGIKPLYNLWVAEVSTESEARANGHHPLHWHMAYFAPAYNTTKLHYHAQAGIKLWKKRLGQSGKSGNLHFKKKGIKGNKVDACTLIEKRLDNVAEGKQEIMGWISYMAKVKSKLELPPHVNMFNGSNGYYQ